MNNVRIRLYGNHKTDKNLHDVFKDFITMFKFLYKMPGIFKSHKLVIRYCGEFCV